MAHAVVTQVLLGNKTNVIVKVTIKGDGASGELSDQVIFDASAYAPLAVSNKIYAIEYCLNGFTGELQWDATTDVVSMALAKDHPYFQSYEWNGGLINNAGTGVTGDILLTTDGLSAQTYAGHIMLYMKKRKTAFRV